MLFAQCAASPEIRKIKLNVGETTKALIKKSACAGPVSLNLRKPACTFLVGGSRRSMSRVCLLEGRLSTRKPAQERTNTGTASRSSALPKVRHTLRWMAIERRLLIQQLVGNASRRA